MAAPSDFTDSNLCVFLLGAGNSVHLGPPIMRDFMDTARRNYFERKMNVAKHEAEEDIFLDAYETLLTFYDTCRASSWAFQRDWDNIEELYTQADLLRLTNDPDTTEAQRRCNRISWAIWDVYRRLNGALGLEHICQNVIKAGLRPVIITTNYDLACESAIRPHRIVGLPGDRLQSYYPGFARPINADSSELLLPHTDTLHPFPRTQGMVPVIKLHGSVNWFILNESEWVATTAFGGPTPSFRSDYWIDEPNVDILHVINKILDEAITKKVIPVRDEDFIHPAIIPPMLGKTSVSPIIVTQWKMAIQALAAARQIFVIGYSFPQTDAFMSRLLTRGLALK